MFQNVTLELSLKPFKKTDEAYIRHVCEELFAQWRPLLKNRSAISLMLWVGDAARFSTMQASSTMSLSGGASSALPIFRPWREASRLKPHSTVSVRIICPMRRR